MFSVASKKLLFLRLTSFSRFSILVESSKIIQCLFCKNISCRKLYDLKKQQYKTKTKV